MRKLFSGLTVALALSCSVAQAKFSDGYYSADKAGAFDVPPETTKAPADSVKLVNDKIAAAAMKVPAPVAAVPARQINANPQGCANGQCGRSR
jgi:hypothetical protein